MASKKEVTVVINGEEYVSKAAESAGASLTVFGKKIPLVLDATKLLEMGINALNGAFNAAKDFVVDSFAAYDNFANSQNKLAAQSKLTGVSMAELNATAKTARDEFGLGSVAANDAATTVAKYATRAGDATLKNKLLAAALNLGAASGLDAAASMEALEQGLRGQDEGFDKLLGKNPSGIWKDYADANGLAVGKMTDAQKRMAELTAVVDAGNTVGNVYNDRLKTASGQQELMNNKLENAKVAFGATLQPVRALVISGLTKLLDIAVPVVVTLGKMANAAGLVLGEAFQSLRGATGAVVEVFGRLTGNTSLENWGKAQQTAADAAKLAIQKMGEATTNAATASTNAATAHTNAASATESALTSSASAAEAAAARVNAVIAEKLGPPLSRLIGITTTAIDDLGKSARDQLPPEKAQQFDAHMQSLAANAKLVGERITALKGPTDNATESTKRLAEDIQKSKDDTLALFNNVSSISRAALDAAGGFGIVDDKAKKALESVLSMGTSLAQLYAGNAAGGIVGLLGAVGSIVGFLREGSADRKAMERESQERLRDNTRQVQSLTKTMGLINLDVKGGDVAKIETVLAGLLPKITGLGPINSQIELSKALQSVGMSLDQFDEVAKKFGFDLFDKNRVLKDPRQLGLFLSALQGTNTAAPATDYASQLDVLKTGFSVNKTSAVDQISQLLGLGVKQGAALGNLFDPNNLENSRARLQLLFNDMVAGRVSESSLGGLSGAQFLSLITDIISRIDNLKPADSASSNSIGGTGSGGTSSITVPGVGPVATGTITETVQAVLKSEGTATRDILKKSLDYTAKIEENTANTVQRLDLIYDVLLKTGGLSSGRTANVYLEEQRRLYNLDVGTMPVIR